MPSLRTFLVLALPLTACGQGAFAQTWKPDRPQHGIRVESRIVAGERFEELRLTTDVHLPPEKIAAYLMGGYLDVRNSRITRTFANRTGTTVEWSDLLLLPMLSPRCYTMRFNKRQLPSGEIQIGFTTQDQLPRRIIRNDCTLLHARGTWQLAPTKTGTRLTYQSLTDVGGKVPAGLASRTLRDAAVTSVRKVTSGAAGSELPRGAGD